MKKLFLSICLITAVSFTFAQKSNVSKAENLAMQEKPDFNGAREAIKAAMQDESTKKEAKTYYVAGLIGQKENESLDTQLMLGQKIDVNQKGKAILESYKYFLIADSLDNLPDAKGRIKPKFSKKIKEVIKEYYNKQSNLYYYAGNAYDGKDYQTAFDAFNTYLGIPALPLMASENLKIDGNIKYYTAYAAVNLGKHAEAVGLYKQLKNDTVRTADVYQLLATEYLAMKDTANYLSTLKEGFDKFKTDPWYLQSIINHYIYTNKIEEAAKYLDDAIAQSPNVSQYYPVKGNIQERLGNLKDARAAFDKALELDPNSAEAYGGIGRLIFNQGVLVINEAINIKDNKLYQKEKERADKLFADAMPFLKKAIELNPKDNDYKYALKQVYYRLNMQKEYDEMTKELGN